MPNRKEIRDAAKVINQAVAQNGWGFFIEQRPKRHTQPRLFSLRLVSKDGKVKHDLWEQEDEG